MVKRHDLTDNVRCCSHTPNLGHATIGSLEDNNQMPEEHLRFDGIYENSLRFSGIYENSLSFNGIYGNFLRFNGIYENSLRFNGIYENSLRYSMRWFQQSYLMRYIK